MRMEELKVHEYACRLAKRLYDKHYRKKGGRFELLPTTVGVLTQIDSMTAGMVRRERGPAPNTTPDTGPDWEGFAKAITGDWPDDDVDGADVFQCAVKHRLIIEVPGGFDPDKHDDDHGIGLLPGDPFFQWNDK